MERLWTPWRSAYVGGAAKSGCPFCERPAAGDDAATLILLRGERCFVIMNLYPYNTGHLMIVPYRHLADPGALAPEEWHELVTLLPRLTAALTETMRPDGFNVGMNIGSAAGAGIADHLHLHVVPRWAGDTNFMPVLGATKVLPELLPETYARLRRALGLAEEPPVPEAAAIELPGAMSEHIVEGHQDEVAAAAEPSPWEDVPGEPVSPPPDGPPAAEDVGGSAPAAVAQETEATAGPAGEGVAEAAGPAVPQAGAVVLVRDKVALRLTKDGAWVLPKGHIEAGETPAATAQREVAEEMGLSGTLGPVVGELRFVQAGRARHVVYFLFQAGRPLPAWEEHLGRDTFLFSPREAAERLTHPDARVLLGQALAAARRGGHR